MRIILLAVTSIDGFITNGLDHNIYAWTSPEDQKFFFEKIEQAQLIFMGSKTYEIARHMMKHRKGRTRIVFTRNPEKYKKDEIPRILEFTKESPPRVISRFKKITEALLVGGSEINFLFLKNNLISEMYITIEPLIFGSGKALFDTVGTSRKFQLVSSKKLNTSGTIQNHYQLKSS